MKYVYVIAIILALFLTFPYSSEGKEFNKGEVYWLTQNIYHESRGEDIIGQLMVGIVTMERLHDGRWGDTIKRVVTSPYQFSWYSDDKTNIPDDKKSWDDSKKVALLSIMLYNSIKGHGMMYYHNNTVNPDWTEGMIIVTVIGRHIFYKEKK